MNSDYKLYMRKRRRDTKIKSKCKFDLIIIDNEFNILRRIKNGDQVGIIGKLQVKVKKAAK